MTAQVSPRPKQIFASNEERYTVVAFGDPVYYKSTRDVSSSSYDGILTDGQSIEIDDPIWVVTAANKGGGFPGSARVELLLIAKTRKVFNSASEVAESYRVEDDTYDRYQRLADGTVLKGGGSSPPSVESVGAITRDAAGNVTAFGGVSGITRDATGRVTGFVDGAATRTITRDSQGRVLEVA